MTSKKIEVDIVFIVMTSLSLWQSHIAMTPVPVFNR